MTHFINKTKALLVAGTVALTFGFAGTAQAITIDFSSGTKVNSNKYVEDNLTVKSTYPSGSRHIHLPNVGGTHGNVLYNHSGCCSTPYRLNFDMPINLISFEYKGTGQISSFLTDAPGAVAQGLVNQAAWLFVDVATMVNFPNDFLNITLITWSQISGSLMIDNLVYDKANDVAPIPEPSTMLLLGSGLAGIVGWRYRKQQA